MEAQSREHAVVVPWVMATVVFLLLDIACFCPTVRSTNAESVKDATKDKLLLAAVRAGNIQSVKKLLVEGANVDFKGEEGLTASELALYKGHAELVTLLNEWKNGDKQLAIKGEEDLLGVDPTRLLETALHDTNQLKRLYAVRQIPDEIVLAQIVRGDFDKAPYDIQAAARTRLLELKGMDLPDNLRLGAADLVAIVLHPIMVKHFGALDVYYGLSSETHTYSTPLRGCIIEVQKVLVRLTGSRGNTVYEKEFKGFDPGKKEYFNPGTSFRVNEAHVKVEEIVAYLVKRIHTAADLQKLALAKDWRLADPAKALLAEQER